MDRPMRLLQIDFDPTVQQQKSWTVQISKLHIDGQITEPRIHTCPSYEETALFPMWCYCPTLAAPRMKLALPWRL